MESKREVSTDQPHRSSDGQRRSEIPLPTLHFLSQDFGFVTLTHYVQLPFSANFNLTETTSDLLYWYKPSVPSRSTFVDNITLIP